MDYKKVTKEEFEGWLNNHPNKQYIQEQHIRFCTPSQSIYLDKTLKGKVAHPLDATIAKISHDSEMDGYFPGVTHQDEYFILNE